MLNKLRSFIEKIATVLAVILMLSLAVLSFVQVMLRNLFSLGFNAVEELMRNGVLWIAFVGAVLTTLRGKHIAIDILPRLARGRFKAILDSLINLAVAVICLVLSWFALQFVMLEIRMKAVIAGFCPAWIIESILPIGFLLLATAFLIRLFEKNTGDAV